MNNFHLGIWSWNLISQWFMSSQPFDSPDPLLLPSSLSLGMGHRALTWVAFYGNLSSCALCAKPSKRFLWTLQASTAPSGHFFLTQNG